MFCHLIATIKQYFGWEIQFIHTFCNQFPYLFLNLRQVDLKIVHFETHSNWLNLVYWTAVAPHVMFSNNSDEISPAFARILLCLFDEIIIIIHGKTILVYKQCDWISPRWRSYSNSICNKSSDDHLGNHTCFYSYTFFWLTNRISSKFKWLKRSLKCFSDCFTRKNLNPDRF